MGTREAILALRLIIERRIRKENRYLLPMLTLKKLLYQLYLNVKKKSRIKKGVRLECTFTISYIL